MAKKLYQKNVRFCYFSTKKKQQKVITSGKSGQDIP